MEVGDVAVIFAAVSAGASSVAAWSSRQSVTRANAPFVWPAIRPGPLENGVRVVYVRLFNDGPGVAFNVRCTAQPEMEPEIAYVTAPIRAMRSGEVTPPHPQPGEQPVSRDESFELHEQMRRR